MTSAQIEEEVAVKFFLITSDSPVVVRTLVLPATSLTYAQLLARLKDEVFRRELAPLLGTGAASVAGAVAPLLDLRYADLTGDAIPVESDGELRAMMLQARQKAKSMPDVPFAVDVTVKEQIASPPEKPIPRHDYFDDHTIFARVKTQVDEESKKPKPLAAWRKWLIALCLVGLFSSHTLGGCLVLLITMAYAAWPAIERMATESRTERLSDEARANPSLFQSLANAFDQDFSADKTFRRRRV